MNKRYLLLALIAAAFAGILGSMEYEAYFCSKSDVTRFALIMVGKFYSALTGIYVLLTLKPCSPRSTNNTETKP